VLLPGHHLRGDLQASLRKAHLVAVCCNVEVRDLQAISVSVNSSQNICRTSNLRAEVRLLPGPSGDQDVRGR